MVSVLMALPGWSVRQTCCHGIPGTESTCKIAVRHRLQARTKFVTRLEALGEDEMVRLCAFALVLMTVEGACAQSWPSRPNTYVRNEIAANETLVKAAGLAAK
jgi:hypothetical protein